MKHTVIAFAAAICLTVPASADVITLASTVPNTGINKVMVDTLTEEMNERMSDDSLDIFLDGTLGGERELIDLVRIGESQIHMGVLHASEYFPNLDATLVPYLFPDYASVEAFLASETGDKLKAVLEEKGNAKFLGTYYQGARWATANKPFTTVDELKGLKVRMPEIPLWIEIWSGLGAVTTPMPSPEVFSALQTGVIDAQENMLSNIYGRRIYEVQKYLVATRHQQSYVTVMANLDFWNGLSAEGQSALQASVDAATTAATEAAEAENERIVNLIKDAGLEVIEPAPEFRQKAMPVIEKAAKGALDDGIYEAAVAVIEAQPSTDTAK
ncbi:TRAP transporter substrate-binding protein [Acuticoccus sp. MNP-M23]|uniref:TRAP transporter substrate-binding protein n=1 Tax=Acuticoccus sp. MNP-M23 TaxID=3072793 RepID=UPI002815E7FC|nr:TRAP transporter substrate-binding protein [Acuticoccus sp. MNP-M23]WMS41920.1 TRAP transporter substrate-binding protein [Acuticoccus sp. MNP-M23]